MTAPAGGQKQPPRRATAYPGPASSSSSVPAVEFVAAGPGWERSPLHGEAQQPSAGRDPISAVDVAGGTAAADLFVPGREGLGPPGPDLSPPFPFHFP